MNLEQQIQTLIENAPQDGNTPQIVEAIIPALKLLAEQLQHLQYYILQTYTQNWVLTTLGHQSQSELEKRVIYAFPTLNDASSSISEESFAGLPAEERIVATPMPVIHILFQMIAIQPLDSLVFFEKPGDLTTATEVKREDVQKLITIYLRQYQASSNSNSSKFPSDIA
ncbi:hypothetical protein [Hydrocoleum sp. CS-953]|uniref:hypothetical protein n=1 Tax=Microcoleaceae TaxID=1892252 RepID=UPI000B9BE172|nr:hypothetical protein [Hydrocoleum sp. CS-953]OZH52937.1 hypothetical protein AFK68_21030 [Hydrocoleum sp. CS-953]